MITSTSRLANLLYSMLYVLLYFNGTTGFYINDSKAFFLLVSGIHLFLMFYFIYSDKINKSIGILNILFLIISLVSFFVFIDYSILGGVDFILIFSYLLSLLYLLLNFTEVIFSKK